MEEDTHPFQCIILYYFKKGKNAMEMPKKKKKDLCHVWRRCCDWSNVSEVVCEVSCHYWHLGQINLCCGAASHPGRCLVTPLASTHWKPRVADSQHAQNIQSNEVIDDNKNVSYISWKKLNRLFGQPSTYHGCLYEGRELDGRTERQGLPWWPWTLTADSHHFSERARWNL